MANATTATAIGPDQHDSLPTIALVGGKASKPWADTPFALISDTNASHPSNAHIPKDHFCREAAYTMAQIHNTILRGVNAIYNQALNIAPGTRDCEDFLFFNRAVYDFLHHHHMNEEQIFFPLLRDLTGDPKFCDTETQEHDAFDAGAGKWKEYIYTVKAEDFDGAKLQAIIDEFGPALHQHLVAEIAWLLTLSKYDSDACKKAFLDTGKKAESELTFQKDLPVILSCQDDSFELDGKRALFPPVPTPLLYLVKWVFARKHAGAWRFAPSDTMGRKRELLAAA